MLARPRTQLALAWVIFSVVSTMYLAPPVISGPTADDFGVSAADVSLLPTANAFTQVVLAMPAGAVLHRIGVSRCVAIGATTFSLAATGCAFAGSLQALLGLQLAFGVAACLSGPGPLTLLVNSWFDASGKAFAVGVLFTAFGVAGVLWPPLCAWVSEAAGWRSVYGMVAVASWLLAFPIAAWLLRDGPHMPRRGLISDARPSASQVTSPSTRFTPSPAAVDLAPQAAAEVLEPASPTDVPPAEGLEAKAPEPQTRARGAKCSAYASRLPWWLSAWRVWSLAAFSFWVMFVTQAFNNYLTLYLATEADVPLTTASAYTSIIYGLNMTGKVLFGLLFDHQRANAYAIAALALWVLGCAMVPRVNGSGELRPGAVDGTRGEGVSHIQLLAFSLVYGLGYGGVFILMQSKPLQLYGGDAGFPHMQGFFLTWQRVGTIAGVSLTGVMARGADSEHAGSFSTPFKWLPLLAALAMAHFAGAVFQPRICTTSGGRGVQRGVQPREVGMRWQRMASNASDDSRESTRA